MSNLLSLVPIQYRILGILLLIATIFGYGWVKGASSVQDKWDGEVQRQTIGVLKIKVKQAEVTERVVIKYVDKVRIIKEKTNATIKEVPKFITLKDDSACRIPSGFVELWNSTNQGSTISIPTGNPDAPASDVKLSDIGEQKVRETGICKETEQQLLDLQDWIRQQQKVKE